MNEKQLESAWFNKTAKVDGLASFKQEMKDKTTIPYWDNSKYSVQGDKIHIQFKGWMYASQDDDWSVIKTNHKNVGRDAKRFVEGEFKKMGLRSKVKVENIKEIDPKKAGWDERDGYVEVGTFNLYVEVELPKYMRPATLEEIAKKLKGNGYHTRMDGDQLEVEFKSDALGKWEYKRWSLNLTQYQDANNKLHQDLAKTLKGMYPKHQVKPDNGYNEMGWAYAYIKMP